MRVLPLPRSAPQGCSYHQDLGQICSKFVFTNEERDGQDLRNEAKLEHRVLEGMVVVSLQC